MDNFQLMGEFSTTCADHKLPMLKLNNMILMGNLNSLTAIDPNLKQIILDCRAQGSITAILFSRNMESLYLYTNQNNLISLDLSMFRPCPGLAQI